MDEVGQESKVTIELPYISGLISGASQLTVSLCCGFTNHHLNHKCEFTIITGKTLRDHF